MTIQEFSGFSGFSQRVWQEGKEAGIQEAVIQKVDNDALADPKSSDLYPRLKKAVESENLAEIGQLLSSQEFLQLSPKDGQSLVNKFHDLEWEWLSSSNQGEEPEKARLLLPIFFHPNWINLDFNRVLRLTLLGPEPYRVNIDRTWADEKPEPSPNVNERRLQELLSHPQFKKAPLSDLRELLMTCVNKRDRWEFTDNGESYFLSYPKHHSKIVHMLTKATVEHPNFGSMEILYLLSQIYAQKNTSRITGLLVTAEMHSTIKDVALGNEETRKPIERLLESSWTNRFANVERLLMGFKEYQTKLNEVRVPAQFADKPDDFRKFFLGNAANILIARFIVTLEAVLGSEQHLGDVKTLLDSELFYYMDGLTVDQEMIDVRHHLDEEGRKRYQSGIVTHPRWMNLLYGDNFKNGLDAILKQQPIDDEKLSKVLDLPIFLSEFTTQDLSKIMIEIFKIDQLKNVKGLDKIFAKIFQHPKFQYMSSKQLQEFIVFAAMQKLEPNLISLFIDQLAKKQGLKSGSEAATEKAAGAVGAAAGVAAAAVEVAAAGVATAGVEVAAAGGRAVEESRTGSVQSSYDRLISMFLLDDGIDLIIKNPDFERISDGVISAIERLLGHDVRGSHDRWLDKLVETRFVSGERASQIRGSWNQMVKYRLKDFMRQETL